MVRKLLLTIVLVAALVGVPACSNQSAAEVCHTGYSVSYDISGPRGASLEGSGVPYFSVADETTKYTIGIVYDYPAVILDVKAGYDSKHLVSYGDFRPGGTKKTTVPRVQRVAKPNQAAIINTIVYVCGELR